MRLSQPKNKLVTARSRRGLGYACKAHSSSRHNYNVCDSDCQCLSAYCTCINVHNVATFSVEAFSCFSQFMVSS